MTVTTAPCPTCTGPLRETVGMVCQTCGTDYSSPMPAASPRFDEENAALWPGLGSTLPSTARSGWVFQLVHGPVEDAGDQELIEDLAQTATRLGASATWVRDDRVTFVFDADHGRAAVLALSGLSTTRGRFWWRTHTRFGGDA